MNVRSDLKLVTGNANVPLATKIAKSLGRELTKCTVSRFSDGELFIQIEENIRQKIFSSINKPVTNLLQS